MKIGIYSPYLETMTGGEKYIFSIAACLVKNHSVDLFWDDKDILEKASQKFNLKLEGVKVKPNIFSTTTSAIKRLKETYSYDRMIVLSDGSIPLVASKELILHFQFPVQWVNANSPLTKIKMKRVSKVICNSYYTKQYIDKKFGIQSYVLYPPSDINTEEIPKKENLILTVGRFNPLTDGTDFKKLSVMITAFKEFQKKRLKGWKFAIVTNVLPENEKEFEAFKKNIGSQYIEVYKNVPFSEIEKLYGKAKVYWHAAGFGVDEQKHPEWLEHFGMSTVEAMSYGAVPVVINAGGQKEIIKSGSNGYLWDTTDKLVQFTHKIATDPKLYESLTERGQADAKQFSKERFCEELSHVI